jgi:hypothetical protein
MHMTHRVPEQKPLKQEQKKKPIKKKTQIFEVNFT